MLKKPHYTNFIRNIIEKDIKDNNKKIITRFPPEPNGYIHIGHIKSIVLNFGLAELYQGDCHLRFDDTNPMNVNLEFITKIQEDIKWLGFTWNKKLFFTSDYFETMYHIAVHMIKNGDAYVCDLNTNDIKKYRGTLIQKGINSPYRERSVEENLERFQKMFNGEFHDGHCTLRAKIDMSSGNINMRDPTLYRIKKMRHLRTGTLWYIYPMYDFAHAIADSLENITHSLCTLEFEDHRLLYDWIIKKSFLQHHPKQIEFSRFNLSFNVTSKRKMKYLVTKKLVNGWNDPRLSTIQGLRRRGVPAIALRELIEMVGISKQNSLTSFSLFEKIIRKHLNKTSIRKNVVLDPVLVEIDHFDTHYISAPNHPNNPIVGRRNIMISSKIYIEKNDFRETVLIGEKKLTLNGRIRLLNAYVIECYKIEKDHEGNIIKLICRYFGESLYGKTPDDGIKPRGIIHWVDVQSSRNAEIRQYDCLFFNENPNQLTKNLEREFNKSSLIIKNAKVEPSLYNLESEQHVQFNRIGYFYTDHNNNNLICHQTVTLKDNYKT